MLSKSERHFRLTSFGCDQLRQPVFNPAATRFRHGPWNQSPIGDFLKESLHFLRIY